MNTPLALKDRAPLAKQHDLLMDAKNKFLVLIYYSEQYACIWEKLPKGKLSLSVKEILTKTKKVKRFLLTFPLRFPFVSREKLRDFS